MATTPDYSSRNYWDSRYQDEDHFEWLGHGYDGTLRLLEREIGPKTARVLILGCGSSRLSFDLHQLGFVSILSTDISPVCIAKQKERHPDLAWRVADMTDLSEFADDGSFDAVVEKATIDSLLAGERSPWEVSEQGRSMVDRTLCEVSRVLVKDGGKFISVTFTQPHFRTPMYAVGKYGWDLRREVIDRGDSSLHYFCFLMTRGKELSQEAMRENAVLEHHRQCRRSQDEIVSGTLSDSEEDENFILEICLE